MMTLYTSTATARDHIAILYYSIVLTVITIAAAMTIGVIQLLNLVLNVAEPEGRFWDGVQNASDHYDMIGVCICASFVVLGSLSVLLYTPWRRRIERRRDDFGGSMAGDGYVAIAGSSEEQQVGLISDDELEGQGTSTGQD